MSRKTALHQASRAMIMVKDNTENWQGFSIETNFRVLVSGVDRGFAERYAAQINQVLNDMTAELEGNNSIAEQTALPLEEPK